MGPICIIFTKRNLSVADPEGNPAKVPYPAWLLTLVTPFNKEINVRYW